MNRARDEIKQRAMNFIQDRLDEMFSEQEECLERIPIDMEFEDMVESEYFEHYERYEELESFIKAFKEEITFGRSLNSIEFTY